MQNRQQKISSLLKKARIERTGTLDLSNQGLNILDIPQICDFLNANLEIQHINLSSNYFGPEAAKLLASSVSLLSLDISNNLICDTGAIALANMHTLKILNLANNHLTDESLPALLGYFHCEVILDNPHTLENIAFNNRIFRYDDENVQAVPDGVFEHVEEHLHDNVFDNHFAHLNGEQHGYNAFGNLVNITYHNNQNIVMHTFNYNIMPRHTLNQLPAAEQVRQIEMSLGYRMHEIYGYGQSSEFESSDTPNNCTDIMFFKEGRTLVDKHIATIEKGIIENQDEQFADVLKSFKQPNKTHAYVGHNNGNPEQLTANNYFTKERKRLTDEFNKFKNIATNNGKRLPSLLNCTLMFFNCNPQYARDEVPDELQKHLIAEPGARPAL